jgi:hypothetical protein
LKEVDFLLYLQVKDFQDIQHFIRNQERADGMAQVNQGTLKASIFNHSSDEPLLCAHELLISDFCTSHKHQKIHSSGITHKGKCMAVKITADIHSLHSKGAGGGCSMIHDRLGEFDPKVGTNGYGGRGGS